MDMETKLQTLWIFMALNYVYGDVLNLFDKTIVVNLDQTALLGASFLVETVVIMVLLTRVLKRSWNRIANIVFAGINLVAAIASLVTTVPSAHYAFFAAIYIITTVVIIWQAWKWPKPEMGMASDIR